MADIGTVQALREMMESIDEGDTGLVIRAVALMPQIRHLEALEVSVGALSDRRREVRLSAITSLGEMGEAAAEHLVRVVRRRSWWRDDSEERIAAVEALGRTGAPDALACLEQIAASRPLIRLAGHDRLTAAAKRVLERLARRESRAA